VTYPPQSPSSECRNNPGIRLAARVLSFNFIGDKLVQITLDQGAGTAVEPEFFASLLDADDRPATRWVHLEHIDSRTSRIYIPRSDLARIGDHPDHAAVVQHLTDNDRFPDHDPRNAR